MDPIKSFIPKMSMMDWKTKIYSERAEIWALFDSSFSRKKKYDALAHAMRVLYDESKQSIFYTTTNP